MASSASDDDDEITGINVTPLVDVTLVLLIIFMVTTSSISREQGLAITKPEAATGATLEEAQTVLVSCTSNGVIAVDGTPLADDAAITQAIVGKLAEFPNLQGVLQCDEQAPVGTLVRLLDLLRAAGVKKYAIATRKPDAKAGS